MSCEDIRVNVLASKRLQAKKKGQDQKSCPLKTNPNFDTNAPPFEIRGYKVILGGAKLKTVLRKRHDFCL